MTAVAETTSGAEDQGEQEEAQPEDEGEHDRQPLVDDVGVVDVLRGGAADQHAGVGPVERGGNQVGAEPVEPSAGLGVVGVTDQRDADERDLAVLGDLLLCRAEVRVVGDGRLERVRWLRSTSPERDVAGDDHLGRVGRRGAREAPLERQGAGLGEGVVGQRVDPGGAGVEAQHREGRGEQDQHAGGQEGRRAADHGTHGPGPERALGGVVAADDRQPQRVDPVAQQGQQGGQQGEGGGHGDHADDDRAEGQAAQDRVRDQEQAEQGHDEGAAGEQDGLAAGAAGGDDRVDLVAAGLPLLPVAGEHEEAVVDAEREPHRGDHVDDEERQDVNWPSTEEMATVTMMDTIAMLIGMNAATRAPKTRISTIIAAGSPNFSSPLVRSDSESSLKSWSRVLTPVMSTSKRGVGVGGDDLVQHVDDPGLGVVAEHQRHDGRVPVLGDAGLVGGVGVPDGLGRARALDRGPDVGDEGLELRVVDW